MITVDGYKAFHGILRVKDILGMLPDEDVEADWIFIPKHKEGDQEVGGYWISEECGSFCEDCEIIAETAK